MRKYIVATIIAAWSASLHAQTGMPATTAGQPAPTSAPSTESVEHLLDTSHAHALLDNVIAQMHGLLARAEITTVESHHLTPDQQAELRNEVAKLEAGFREELSWDKVKGVFIQAYASTFTQDEVNALAKFYDTPEGQSIIGKMPLVMQKTSRAIQPQLMHDWAQTQEDLRAFVAKLAPPPTAHPGANGAPSTNGTPANPTGGGTDSSTKHAG